MMKLEGGRVVMVVGLLVAGAGEVKVVVYKSYFSILLAPGKKKAKDEKFK